MSMENVKTALLVNSSCDTSSCSVLMRCARFWTGQGKRVLFISKNPLKHFPLADGKTKSEAFKLIQFMYLANWKELLHELYSIHLQQKPASVIIVKNIENYFKYDLQVHNHQDHVSLICASLLYAISISAKVVSDSAFLISDYFSKNSSIEKTIIKNFFHNVWELKALRYEDERGCIKLSRFYAALNDEIAEFIFHENLRECMLSFVKIIKKF